MKRPSLIPFYAVALGMFALFATLALLCLSLLADYAAAA